MDAKEGAVGTVHEGAGVSEAGETAILGTLDELGKGEDEVSEIVVADSPQEPAKPAEPLTETFMRKLRLKYFTVRHPRVPECGHKLDQINEPRTNCHTCWYVWFEIHPQLVEVADQFYKTEGKRPLIGMRGEKFVKMFEKYMATKFNELQLAEQEKNGTSGETDGGSGINAVPQEGEGDNPSSSPGAVNLEVRETEVSGGGSETA